MCQRKVAARDQVIFIELRVMQDLSPLKGVWSTTLHASGIRLRNASNWQETLSA